MEKFLYYFNDPLMYVLLLASGLKFIVGSNSEAIIVLLVATLNALIGYYQEKKADKSIRGISNLLSLDATIETEKGKKTILSEELVPGDHVYLKSGDVVPADLRLISINKLTINESILTGEVEPVIKNIDPLPQTTILADRINMAYSGTMVQEGTGLGIVTEIGPNTELGKINRSLGNIEQKDTPLLKKVNEMNSEIFKGIGLSVVLLSFICFFLYDMSISYILTAMIALIISSIPEGLPSILTIILSSGMNNMSKKNAIVKNLPTVETLGSVTTICSDKTGTLTKNDMSLSTLYLNKKLISIDDNVASSETLNLLSEIMQNCQDTISFTDSIIPSSGNPTETALLRWTVNRKTIRYNIEEVLPFDSKYKYMATSYIKEGKKRIFVKGASDVLFNKSTKEFTDRKIINFSSLDWNTINTEMANNGQRVLAFAYKDVDISCPLTHEIIEELTIVGLAGIIDPPKESAMTAIKECKDAGIRVVMITGDHPATALSIAKKIGIEKVNKAITGPELDKLTETEWSNVVKSIDVFARTTPEHKLSIVSHLQKQNEIVGMTGDGVNDAPALKKADIGIAMGIKGSEVSKQTGDMILVDDNFETISTAVKEGRRIFDNLKKTILFYLPTCLAQGLLLVISLLGNFPIPLTTIQILWLNLVASITLSYALGFEAPEKNIMKRPPRDMNEKLISRYTLFRIVYVGFSITLISFAITHIFSDEYVRQTLLINSIVFCQALYMLNCRSILGSCLTINFLKNKTLIISLVVMSILQLLMTYFKPMNEMLQTVPLTFAQLLVSVLPSVILFLIIEAEKSCIRKMTIK